ncbi:MULTISPECIES: site-specific DNA-methyltransferase [Paenibacillus]|uniref:site-specific DNA-methyltransferase n=1 Tax=Paenibacillus TaxID=44249 RepID=UPI00096FC4E0|nr:site-specific DNA-methyltransferase [Paenibacillus odorifer]OME52822.1 site-specific DNA-methyltransferase [Paenibacillus odorifer]
MSKKTKLELTWIGKEEGLRLEPRILLNNPDLSYHSKLKVTQKDEYENMLIYGDNLLALKALQNDYIGKVKCIFIDPPYNTGSAFVHYDDGIEHSIWLSMMRDRLVLLWNLLCAEGSLWITIDDNEAHYLKVLCDELFGRNRFVTSFIWKKVDSPNDNKVAVTPDHEYVLCYSKTPGAKWFKQMKDDSILEAYHAPDNESDRPYRDRLLKKNGKNSLRIDRPSMFFPIISPNGNEVYPIHDDGREARWAMGKQTVDELVAESKLIWKERIVNGSKQWVPYTREFAPENPTRPYPSIWNDLNTTRQTKAHHKSLFGENLVFDTPKPEDLIARILNISTELKDIVLDSFAGSGTTGAVAHKMGRRWIMIEMGEHCHTHIIPRLKKVIDGTDKGGISKEVNWQGGGGFRYYRLAPSLLEKDKFGNWIINKEYNAPMLAEAMCKHHGFKYSPDETVYWKQGWSTETDYIYTTTQLITREIATQIHDSLGENETLLICCKAFNADSSDYPNITFKKIPSSILNRCEFGRDDYSLNVAALPQLEKIEQMELFSEGEEL